MTVSFALEPSESICLRIMIGIWSGDSLMEVCASTWLTPKKFVLSSLGSRHMLTKIARRSFRASTPGAALVCTLCRLPYPDIRRHRLYYLRLGSDIYFQVRRPAAKGLPLRPQGFRHKYGGFESIQCFAVRFCRWSSNFMGPQSPRVRTGDSEGQVRGGKSPASEESSSDAYNCSVLESTTLRVL